MAREPIGHLAKRKFTSEEFNEALKKNFDKKKKPTDDDEWETIADDEDDWETVADEPASEPFPESKSTSGFWDSPIGKGINFLNEPLSGGYFGRKSREIFTPPPEGEKEIIKHTGGQNKLQDFLAEVAAAQHGFARGAKEGLGDVADMLTTPSMFLSLAGGGGAGALAARGLKGAKTLSNVTRGIEATQIPHGGRTALDSDESTVNRLFGALEAVGGFAGARYGNLPSPKSPNAPRVEPIAKPVATSAPPKTEGNIKFSTKAEMDAAKPAPANPKVNEVLSNAKQEDLSALLYHEDPVVREAAAGELQRRDPNNNQGAGDPELAGSAPAPRTFEGPPTDDAVASIFPGLQKRASQSKGGFSVSKAATAPVSVPKPTVDPMVRLEELGNKSVLTKEESAEFDQLMDAANPEPANMSERVRNFAADEKGELDINALFEKYQRRKIKKPPVEESIDNLSEAELGIGRNTNHPDTLELGELPRGEINLNQAAVDAGSDLARSVTPQRPKVEYAFDWPEFHEDGSPERMFHVVDGPEAGTTLSESTLNKRGIQTQQSAIQRFLTDDSGEFNPDFMNTPGKQEFSPDLVEKTDDIFEGTSPRFEGRTPPPDAPIEPTAPTFSERLMRTLQDESGAVPRRPKGSNVWANLDSRVKSVFQENGIGPDDLEGMTLKDVNDTYDSVVNEMAGVEPQPDLTPKLVGKEKRRGPLTEDEQIERLTRDAMAAVDRERSAMLKSGETELSPEELSGFREQMQSGNRFAEDVNSQAAPIVEKPLLRSKDYIKNFMKDEKGELNLEGLFGEVSEPNPRRMPLLPGADDIDPYLPVQERTIAPPTEQSLFGKIKDAPKGLMSVDLPFMTSAAFRQAKPLAWTSDWFKAWGTAAKAYGGDEAAYKIMEQKWKESKYFKPRYKPNLNAKGEVTGYKEVPSPAEEIGVHLAGGKFGPAEQQIRSQLAEKMPGVWGDLIRRSNRAYQAFINDLRVNKTTELLDQLEWTGADNDKVVAKALGEFINDATGRGSLKWAGPGGRQANLERIAPVLENTMWSSRLFAANTKFLNPFTYTSTPGPVRQEYINGALRMAATWTGFAGLAKMAGAEVNLDPTNSDFGKIKIGNTRVDPAGGMQQLMVFLAREAPKAVGEAGGFETGKFTSSSTGKSREYGTGAFPIDRASVAEDFAASKLDPVTRLAYELMRSSDKRPVHLGDKTVQMVLPIMAQDIMDAMKEDPSLERLLGTALGSSIGMGVNTYGKGERISDPVFTDSIEQYLGQTPGSMRGTITKW